MGTAEYRSIGGNRIDPVRREKVLTGFHERSRTGKSTKFPRSGSHTWATYKAYIQGVREIEEWMSRSSGIPLETLRQYLFLFRDRDATSHLLRSAPKS